MNRLAASTATTIAAPWATTAGPSGIAGSDRRWFTDLATIRLGESSARAVRGKVRRCPGRCADARISLAAAALGVLARADVRPPPVRSRGREEGLRLTAFAWTRAARATAFGPRGAGFARAFAVPVLRATPATRRIGRVLLAPARFLLCFFGKGPPDGPADHADCCEQSANKVPRGKDCARRTSQTSRSRCRSEHDRRVARAAARMCAWMSARCSCWSG